MSVRAFLDDEEHAHALAARVRAAGFEAVVRRDRFAGEDDDEDRPWVVDTDAPAVLVEVAVEEHDGWVEDLPEPTPAPAPLDLPAGPRRVKGHWSAAASAAPPRLAPMDQRLLLVHAHPDDESIGQGATMAKYAARGTQVTLVTCTLGEEGEVLVPDLAHLASDKEDGLGRHRITELANAMKELGVTDHRFLGGAGHFRDSGMVWAPEGHATAGEDVKDGTFWRADLTAAADLLVEIIREVRPQVLVTYDQFGGYGHPDHIQAHRVATYAAALAPVRSYRTELGEPWEIDKIYWGAMSANRMREGLRRLREAGDTTTFEGMDPDGPLPPFMVPDELLDAVVVADDFVDAKLRAMKAHATQIEVDGPFFALSNNLGSQVWGTEFFRLAKGTKGPTNDDGLETDLFAGLS